MLNRFKFLLAGICLIPTFALANFTISPVKLTINKDQKVTALTLSNNTDMPKSFQLTAGEFKDLAQHTVISDYRTPRLDF